MRVQTQYEDIGILDSALAPRAAPKAEAGIRFFQSRLLEVTVGGLLALWWLQVFGLWVSFLQWAASLGVPLSF